MALSSAFGQGAQAGSQAVTRGIGLRQSEQQIQQKKQEAMLSSFNDMREQALTTAKTIRENATQRQMAGEQVDMGKVNQLIDTIKNKAVLSATALRGGGLPVDPDLTSQQFEAIKSAPTAQQQAQVAGQTEAIKQAKVAEATGETATFYDPETDSFEEIRVSDKALIDKAIQDGKFKMPAELSAGDTTRLTKSGANKIEQTMIDDEISTKQNIKNIQPIIDLISSDDYVGGVSGQLLQNINSAVAQYRQLTGQDSVLTEDGQLDESKVDLSEENMGRFRRAAATSERTGSAVLELAYLHAKSLDPGGRLSDADVRNAERILGDGADKATRIRLLRDLQERMVRNYNVANKVRSRALGIQPDPISIDEIKGEERPPIPTSNGDDAATSILRDAGLLDEE